jgi:sulfite reductase (ferredoxin)
LQYDDVTYDPDEVVEEFKERYFDTKLFDDPFAGPKFANYFMEAWSNRNRQFDKGSAHTFIEEASLFVEACYSCHGRMSEKKSATA